MGEPSLPENIKPREILAARMRTLPPDEPGLEADTEIIYLPPISPRRWRNKFTSGPGDFVEIDQAPPEDTPPPSAPPPAL